MARLYPDTPREGATRGEQLVLHRLEELDDEWCVLHSLDYLTMTDGSASPGEIDFVLLHRRFGVVVLEIKDGRYRITNRQWIARTREGDKPVRDPFVQARDNHFTLIEWLKDKARVSWVPIGYCVIFTHGRPSGPLGPHAPDPIVLTAASLSDPTAAIMKVVKHFRSRPWSPSDYKRAFSALCTSATVEATIDFDLDVSGAALKRLTAQQIQWTSDQLDALTAMSSTDETNLLVIGAAGTGKTLLAQERARVLAAEKARVALIGQHRHLRLQLRHNRLDGVPCGDVLDVLAELYGTAAVGALDSLPLPEITLQLAAEHGPKLDHLIVDEAQSHEDSLLLALREIVEPKGSMLLLADPYQRDETGRWTPPGQYRVSPLITNCRNVLPIAKLVAELGGARAPQRGVDGLPPLFTESVDVVNDTVAVVGDLLTRLGPNRIVVLTETSAGQQSVRTALSRANPGLQLAMRLGDPGLLISTVENFRGCEAEAVVYLAERPRPSDRTRDYLAVSRACAYLHVVSGRRRWEKHLHLMGDQP